MFLDGCWQKRRFAWSARYNPAWIGPPLRPAVPWAGADSAALGNHHPYSLFRGDDMTNCTGAQDQAGGASALLQPWRHIAQQLCPLIGDSGFCALFVRAVHMLGPEHAWLAPQQPCRSPEQLFALLAERLTPGEARRAAAANGVLLQTFTQLLATLIGEALTERLLASATAVADTQANAQEQNK